jgi:hypothetical protein
MSRNRWNLGRRSFLRGAGVTLALPFLEAMQPIGRVMAAGTTTAPLRFAVFRQAQGTVIEHWLPAVGTLDDDLPSLLAPYRNVKDKLTVISNLTSSGMIGGKHYRNGHDLSKSLFTAAPQVDQKAGTASISIDQYIAQHIGKGTPITSLGLSNRSQNSDLFWTNETTKLPLEGNPRLVFDRIFRGDTAPSNDAAGRKKSTATIDDDRSILDLVMDQTRSLKRDLGLNDQRHLDQYMDSVRQLERGIAMYEDRKLNVIAERDGISLTKIPDLPAKAENYSIDRNDPEQADRHVRIMCDLVVLGFQTDSTRVAAMDFDFGYFPDIVSVGTEYDFHTLAHHGSKKTVDGSDPVAREAVREIYYWHSKQVAYLAQRMDEIEEPSGTLLDNSLIVHTSELAFGDHFADNIPMALIGRAGGNLRSGQHLACKGVTPVSHLWTDIANRMGVPTEAFGNAKNHPNNVSASLPSLG